MSAGVRLLRIETRRSAGLLFFPVLVFAAYWVVRGDLPHKVALWNASAYATKETVIFLGPLMAGLAAWTAGRNGRRGMDELPASTPKSPASRDLTTGAGVALWGVAAYGASAAALAAVAYPRATWGTPPLTLLVQGLLALASYTAAGYAIGYYLRSRFVIPLVPVAAYIVPFALLVSGTTSLQNLIPFGYGYGRPSVFYFPDLEIHLAMSGWMLGLAAVAAAVIVLRSQRTPLSYLATVAAIGLAGVSASALLGAPRGAGNVSDLELDVVTAREAPYEPVCEAGHAMTVCVHPAYSVLLPQAAQIANKVVAPIAGIPGVPTRVEQAPELASLREGSIRLPEYHLMADDAEAEGEVNFARNVAYQLVTVETATPKQVQLSPNNYGCADAMCEQYWSDTGRQSVQGVVSEWLWRQAGYGLIGMGPQGPVRQNESDIQYSSPDAKRIIELDPARRRAWLAENFEEMRAGTLTLEDLP